jgi:hypothetical protein
VAAPVEVNSFFDPLQPRLGVHRIGRKSANCETRSLVKILMIGLDHQNLVAIPDLFHETADRGPLGFETACLGDVQLQVRNADVGFSAQFPIGLLPSPLQLRRDLHHLVGLDDVAFFDVVIAGEADAALESLSYLGRIVLESPQ